MAKELSLGALLEALSAARARVAYLDGERPPGWARLLGKAVHRVEDLSVDLQVYLRKGSAPVVFLQYTGPGQTEYVMASPQEAEVLLATGRFRVLPVDERPGREEEG